MNTEVANDVSITNSKNFFLVAAISAATIVLIGFAPSFYLRNLFATEPLPSLLWWHGVIFSSWLLLLVIQTTLIRTGNVQLHRRLGLISTLLLPAMLILGVTVALDTAAHGNGGARLGMTPVEFLIIPLGAILIFAVLVTIALILRRNIALHKRLIVIATINLIGPALGRIAGNVFDIGNVSPFIVGSTALLIGCCMIHDRLTRGNIHPGFLIAGPVVLISGPLRVLLSHTNAWHSFAEWLITR